MIHWPSVGINQCQLLFLSTLFGSELETRPVLSLKNPKHIQNIPKNLKQRILIVHDAHQNYQNKKGIRAVFVINLTLEIRNSRPNHQLCKVDLWCPMFIHVLAPSRPSNYNLKTSEVKLRLLQGDLSHLNAGEIEHQHIELIRNSSKVSARDVKITPNDGDWIYTSPKTNECPKKGCHFKKVKACLPITIGFRGVMSNMSSTCRGSIGQ